jgi:two-component system, cell cycle sensor histidine kinase and response regulator CckA
MAAEKDTSNTILIVEDESQVLEMVAGILSRGGYQVLSAKSGDEALQIGRDFSGSIDLVLTDIVMPGMSGGEVVRQLQQLKPEIHVLYMSGYTKYTMVGQGSLESVRSFIWKPFSPDELLGKVREVLENPAEIH